MPPENPTPLDFWREFLIGYYWFRARYAFTVHSHFRWMAKASQTEMKRTRVMLMWLADQI